MEMLNIMTDGYSLPDNFIHLKKYHIVVLPKTLDKKLRHVNCTIYVVKYKSFHFLLLRFARAQNY